MQIWKELEKTWTFWLILGFFLGLLTVAMLMEYNNLPEVCKHLYFRPK